VTQKQLTSGPLATICLLVSQLIIYIDLFKNTHSFRN